MIFLILDLRFAISAGGLFKSQIENQKSKIYFLWVLCVLLW